MCVLYKEWEGGRKEREWSLSMLMLAKVTMRRRKNNKLMYVYMCVF